LVVMAENGPPQTAQEPRSGSTRIEATLENRPICAGIAVPLLDHGDAQKHTTQGRKAAPDGGPIGTKSGGSITPKSGGPIQTKSGGSIHTKSCTHCCEARKLLLATACNGSEAATRRVAGIAALVQCCRMQRSFDCPGEISRY